MTARAAETAEGSAAGVVLTAHPLQRVGAFALAALVGQRDPVLGPGDLDRAMDVVVRAAVSASVRESKDADGFWQKVSLSFFPNSPMNHPGRRKGKTAEGRPKSDADVQAAVRAWLRQPDPADWPGVGCVLCGRRSVGFYGKRDVVLAASDAYRNTTPRGHEGMALCWPCLCCFYALPFGCQLTGGSSAALHSWDDAFATAAVARRVRRSQRLAMTGQAAERGSEVKEVVALHALRAYGERLVAGLQLLVFNNNNRGQLLERHSLEQPLAEWLRKSSRMPGRRRGFAALLWAHATASSPGVVGLARNAFREPARVVSTGVRYLTGLSVRRIPDHDEAHALADLLMRFATEVMQMDEKDLAEIRATARKTGTLLFEATSAGPLKHLRSMVNNPVRLRQWLTRCAVAWAGRDHKDSEAGPLVSERAFVLLFDPGEDNPGWFHRNLLLVGVLEELARRGWRLPEPEPVGELLTALDADDREYLGNETEAEEEEADQ
ncbi:hypothetical protein RKE29_01280 [Streptomyces sp. B1866]|uniref:hypothetical protein n=1 Tax=Streptomyces sp. B1866 TaxID=3075431 RepID=UPI00288FEC6A|nr:hypothetical protein [Streptomyces sp. B1866]MDT3395293.1 hypothetical protein [Streptomyces sp. B1866]